MYSSELPFYVSIGYLYGLSIERGGQHTSQYQHDTCLVCFVRMREREYSFQTDGGQEREKYKDIFATRQTKRKMIQNMDLVGIEKEAKTCSRKAFLRAQTAIPFQRRHHEQTLWLHRPCDLLHLGMIVNEKYSCQRHSLHTCRDSIETEPRHVEPQKQSINVVNSYLLCSTQHRYS